MYHTFDQVLLLSHGRALYSGPGGISPARHFEALGVPNSEGYNIADFLLEIASDPPVSLFQAASPPLVPGTPASNSNGNSSKEKANGDDIPNVLEKGYAESDARQPVSDSRRAESGYATTFLTQLEVLSGREWKILRR